MPVPIARMHAGSRWYTKGPTAIQEVHSHSRRDGQATGMGRREVPFTALSCLSCVQLVYHGTCNLVHDNTVLQNK